MKRTLSTLWLLLSIGFLPAKAQLLASTSGSYRAAQAKETEVRLTTLRSALTDLEQRYRVSFIYPTSLVDTKVIQSKSGSRNLEADLTELLADKGLSYKKVQANFYAIVSEKDKKGRFFRQIERINAQPEAEPAETPGTISTKAIDKLERIGWSMTSAQPLADIGGKVTDKSGQGIPGVSVVIKGTSRGTTTSATGDYSINAPNNAVLVFSFVGYESREVAVSNRSRINVSLTDDIKALSEVVVVGYGTQKRASVTGAISSISSQEVTQLPVPSIESAIQGRVPGVSVVNNGSPGESPIVRIRGIGSILYASNPLYVIDGFPTSDLNNFDSRDIESVDVLKDASAASIYGSRAANGVIVITTKRGKNDGRLHVSYDGYTGVQSAWRQLDLLNTQQYLQYGTALLQNAENDAAIAGNRAPIDARPKRFLSMDEPIYTGASQTYAQTNTNWQKEVFRNAAIQQHSVQVSGGNERSRFLSSVGFFSQDGIMIGTSYKRGNFRINSDHTISKRFTFGQALTIAYSDRFAEVSAGGRTQVQNLIRMTPYMPVTDPFLLGGYRGPDGSDATDPQNPVRAALQDRTNSQQFKLLGSAYLDVKLIEGLTYRVRGGIDYVTNRDFTFQPIYNESFNARALAAVIDNRYVYASPLISNQLTYERTFGKHSINAVAVAERQAGNYNFLNGTGQAASNTIRQVSALTPTSVGIDGGRRQNVLLSYLGRVNYEYDGRYLLSASIRRDGSSKFAPGNKWGNFPSASVGWRVSEEPFIKNVPSISELKLRASYGSMGFNGIGDYDWQVAVAQNTNAIIGSGRTQGFYFDRLGNTALKWEITKMSNVGVDLGLFNNSITMTAEYFIRNTDGLILPQPIAPYIGYSQSPVVNVGNMRNQGFEMQLGYNNQKGPFRYTASANLSVIRNKVLSLGPNVSPLFSGQNADFGGFDITRTVAGEPVQSFYGWKVAGIYQNTGDVSSGAAQPNAKPGDIRFVDTNGDGKIDADDRVNLGSFLPKFQYGFNFSANYSNFDLSLFIQGVQGNKVYNGTRVLTEGMLRLFNSGTGVLQAWTPENTNTSIPRAISGDPNGNTRTSDRFIEDGSYLRLKNLSLGYNLPATTLQGWSRGTLSRARLYVAATNLLTFTKYTGYDPEIGSRTNGTLTNGIDYGQFPQPRTLMAGLQLGF
ncbi:SusC/RagA family TonB-linked outer membrane protein [Spirosoma utsteinense]|uniref:SusC/RagA family TonB-linked outer membrane protein n=1 Tax=Spirosoma utsteinense TaxID=2585773 RepID=UPI001646CAE5|nr:TonB-dependent receptor [Spirosoma utsteinense]MBC3785448.1 TonB-linked SusC/RagA family outer membrane protein [Spirosoma utsteinense]